MNALRVGTFIKTGAVQSVEILGLSGLDFAVLDAEHAPLDRPTLDVLILAGRAAGLPLLVRIPDLQPATILSCLDMGAAGLVVPHVDTVEQAVGVVRRARYDGGERGFSNSPRMGGYGTTTIAEAIARGDGTQIICQIESMAGVENAAAIAATAGVNGLFVGRADLAVSMGLRDLRAPDVVKGTQRAITAALRAEKFAVIAVGSAEEIPEFLEQGVSMFIVGSDQSILRTGAASLARRAAELARVTARPASVLP